MRRLCSTVCELTDISLIMDLTYSGWGVVKKFCELSGIHYIRFDVTIQPYLNMVVDFLENLRNSTDATFVFDTVIGQRQGLSYLLRNSRMRISTFAALTNDVIRSLRTRNPYPTFIVLVGEQTKLQQVFLPTIAKENLIKTDESLVLLPTNMLSVKIKMPKTFAYNVTIFQTQQSLCCYLQENTRTCTCNLMSKFQLLTALISKYANVLNKMLTDLNKSNFLNPRDIHCQVEEDGALTVPDMDVKDRKPLNHLYVFQMTRKSGGKNNGFNESPQSSSSEPLTIQMLMNNGSLLQALSDQIAQKLNTLMEKRVEQLERDVQYLQKENVDLKNKMIELEQYGRRNSIRIFGMQESKDEDTVAAVVQLVNSRLNIQVTNRDVDACHRLGKMKTNGKPRSIICKFTSRLIRDKVYFNKKQLKGTKINIKEDLCKEKMDLFKRVTDKFSYKKVWTLRGNVFLMYKNKKFMFRNVEEYVQFYNENLLNESQESDFDTAFIDNNK
ncbi:hypothetical protein M8J75_016350 [Diaphorina citri]|nr:hypothetical protein M8J75_016350 [Diaphorina citri]